MLLVLFVPHTCRSAHSVLVTTKSTLWTLVTSAPACWRFFRARTQQVRTRSSHTSHAHRWRGYVQLLKWGAVGIFISTIVSVSLVWWEMGSLQQNLSNVNKGITTSIPEVNSPYIYLWRRPMSFHEFVSPVCNSEDGAFWSPWLQSKSHDPWTLLSLCESQVKAIRLLGISALTSKSWEDYQYRYVAQTADVRTLVAIARTKGSNPLFFLPPPTLVARDIPLVEELAILLLELESSSKSKGHGDSADLALKRLQRRHSVIDDKDRFWMQSGASLDVPPVEQDISDDTLELHFLHAMSEMTSNEQQAALLVRQHGLATLQRAVQQRRDLETHQTVANILGNLALDSTLHETIARTGWLGVLKAWTEGTNVPLALAAGRVLANLDRDWTSHVLPDGVFVIHPLYRSRKTVHADIIFVHGLRGGAVKTWRQQDLPSTVQQSYPRSPCWPKDWLAEDCPHVRILSLHYDTVLSAWSGKSAYDKEKKTLEGRSRQFLSKIHQAGVGNRPIIWVGHSMGGLLIKEMIRLAGQDERYSNIRNNTAGLLLYSVPHRGLSLAALTNQAHYLVYPSIEVQELSRDSPHLSLLHKNFRDFVLARNIPCLSFGELKKTQLGKTLPKILLVPPESSDPGFGEFYALDLDHISICKPSDCDSELYEKTLAFIHRCIFLSYVRRLRQGVGGGDGGNS